MDLWKNYLEAFFEQLKKEVLAQQIEPCTDEEFESIFNKKQEKANAEYGPLSSCAVFYAVLWTWEDFWGKEDYPDRPDPPQPPPSTSPHHLSRNSNPLSRRIQGPSTFHISSEPLVEQPNQTPQPGGPLFQLGNRNVFATRSQHLHMSRVPDIAETDNLREECTEGCGKYQQISRGFGDLEERRSGRDVIKSRARNALPSSISTDASSTPSKNSLSIIKPAVKISRIAKAVHKQHQAQLKIQKDRRMRDTAETTEKDISIKKEDHNTSNGNSEFFDEENEWQWHAGKYNRNGRWFGEFKDRKGDSHKGWLDEKAKWHEEYHENGTKYERMYDEDGIWRVYWYKHGSSHEGYFDWQGQWHRGRHVGDWWEEGRYSNKGNWIVEKENI